MQLVSVVRISAVSLWEVFSFQGWPNPAHSASPHTPCVPLSLSPWWSTLDVNVFLVQGSPKLNTGLQLQSHNCQAGGKKHLPWPAGHTPASTPPAYHCSHDGTQLRNVLQRSKMTSNKYANNPFSLILTAKSNIRAVTVCSTDFPIHISTQKHCTQNSSISTHKASLKCCKTFHRQEDSSR